MHRRVYVILFYFIRCMLLYTLYYIYQTILYTHIYTLYYIHIDIKPENILVGYHRPLPSKLMVESILEYSNKKYNSSNKVTTGDTLHMSVAVYDDEGGGTMVKKGKKKRIKKKVSAPVHISDHPTTTATHSSTTHSHIASTHTNHTNSNNKASLPSHSRASRGDCSTQSSLSPLKTGGHNSDPHIHAIESSRSPKKHKKKRKKKKPALSLPTLDIDRSVLPVYSNNSSRNIDFNTSSYTLASPSCRREMIRMEQDEGHNYDPKNKGQNYD